MARQAQAQQLANDTPNLVNAQNQAFTAQEQANQAAFHAGELAGTDSTSRANVQKRLEGVKAALQHWQQNPPKAYVSTAPRVELADPFKPAEAPKPSGEALSNSINGTCLEIDMERGVARVVSTCAPKGCGDRFKPGDYPVLEDGSVLDTPERVQRFFETCKSPSVSAVQLSEN